MGSELRAMRRSDEPDAPSLSDRRALILPSILRNRLGTRCGGTVAASRARNSDRYLRCQATLREQRPACLTRQRQEIFSSEEAYILLHRVAHST